MIPVLIPEVGFEKIRDRIALILMQEFENQVYEFSNENCDGVNFFAERTAPMDKTESPYINISTFKGDYSNKDVEFVDGTYQYVIDVCCGSKKIGNTPADQAANFKVQKLIGIVRYILEHPDYTTLLFDRPFIEHTMLTKFQIYRPEMAPDKADSFSFAIGQAIFSVRCGEVTTPGEGNVTEGQDTVAMIGLTGKGFQYGGASDPPLDPRYVYIINQDGDVIELVPGGETYTITQLTSILQNIGDPVTTIVQEIPQ